MLFFILFIESFKKMAGFKKKHESFPQLEKISLSWYKTVKMVQMHVNLVDNI